MRKLVPLIPRPAAAAFLGISVPTAKRREKDDADFPPPIALSSTRVAYRSDDLAKYQLILQNRATKARPGISDPERARAAANLGVLARRAKRDARRSADRQSAVLVAANPQTNADVPASVPPSPTRRKSAKADAVAS